MSDNHLLIELERLREENRKLRAALRVNGRHGRRIQRAYDAALLLATWHCAYLPTTRAYAMAQGMAQRQWENGIALLRLARVCDQAGRWKCHDLAVIEKALNRAADIAHSTPDAFFARGPRRMRPRRR